MVGPCRRDNTTRAPAAEAVNAPSGPGGGAPTGLSDPPKADGPDDVSASLERLQARRQKAAARRRRRRWLLVIAIPVFGFAVWAVSSYSVWMLKPTSMAFGPRSVEWVRAEFPFGN